ncbi:macrophage mannose receptor 1-like [Acanthochromis polyacanthus]|uniref:macrophage mannose receptor 1-like n=1 Tax=Acanthochromis polyacanthus TaxID=80966 RepID=UPI002234CA1E|nr:macrophage mannose receptor 1-like [Acanthochromis polyacanthus]
MECNERRVKGGGSVVAMEGRTVIVTVLSGLCFLPACVPRKYFLVEKAKTWSESQSYCREKYTDLATAENQEEMDAVVDVAITWLSGHVWIGLHHEMTPWKWSLEDDSYYAEGEKEFRMWPYGEANRVDYDCVALWENGFWMDHPCSGERQFVCSTGTTASSFVFVRELKTWLDAQSYCRQHYTDLASVRSQAENDQIWTMTEGQQCWIGLYRGQWKWSDGTPMSFRQWNPQRTGGVNSPCSLAHQGKWEASICSRTLFFVCYLGDPVRKQVVKIRATQKDSSGSLEDAAEAILLEMSQKLKDLSLSEDLKLSWRKQPDGRIFVPEEEQEKKAEEISCSHT